MIALYLAPKTRVFGMPWRLEEFGGKYELKRPDLDKDERKIPEFL